jgi:hypothetical protein
VKEILTSICALQPKYSSQNTPEMQERGRLIRTDLASALKDRLPRLQQAFDRVFDDLGVEASDGIGRKTEAPWVRLFSRTMSPNPREGFYIVIHFAANGSGVYFTVGCGSTIWSGGDLKLVADDELKARTSWARSVVLQRFKDLAPFSDEISLGAKAPLPRTFEKATAIAKWIPVQDLANVDLDSLLFGASERLGEIYLAQLSGRDVSPGDQDSEDVVAIAKPLRLRRGQGRGLSAIERREVELRAMRLATEHLLALGFQCQDMSATESFDVLAKKNDLVVKVEVKGTTSDFCDSVLMTRNEVELHQKEKGSTALFIVSRIRLVREAATVSATGGEIEALMHWDIDEWSADPVAYQMTRKLR